MLRQSSDSVLQETVESTSGMKIFFRSWRPADRPRATVLIIPGFNAHNGYYGWVAERLVADNLSVYAVDLRGRGKSDGERFYVETFTDYVRDVEAVMSIVHSREGESPVYLLGPRRGWRSCVPVYARTSV